MVGSKPLYILSLGIVLSGCSSATFSKIAGTGDDSGGEDAEDTQGDAPADVTGSYLTDLACGPEGAPPEGIAGVGESAFGCALLPLNSDLQRKIVTPIVDAKVVVALADGRIGNPPLFVADAASRWHVLFALPTAMLSSIREVVMTAADAKLDLKGTSDLSHLPAELTAAEAAEAAPAAVDNSTAARIVEDGGGLLTPQPTIEPASDGGGDGADAGGGDAGSGAPPGSYKIFVTSRNFVIGAAYAAGSVMFATTVTFNDVSQADAICKEMADNARIQATGWKAIISSTKSQAKDRIKINGPIYDVTGKLVVDVSPFWGNVALEALDVNVAESNGRAVGVAWTGTKADGSVDPANCSDWASRTETAVVGSLEPPGAMQWLSSTPHDCTLDAKLYCISGQE